MNVGEMVLSIFIDGKGATKGANDVKKTVKSLASFAVKTLSAVGAYQFLKSSINSLDEMAQHLHGVATATKENAEDVQAWGMAVSKLGGNAEAIESKFVDMSKSIREAFATKTPNEMTQTFNNLGIKLKDSNGQIKTTTRLFTELSGVLENSSSNKQAQIQQKLGLDDATMQLLSKGKAGVGQLTNQMKAYGVITEKQIKIQQEFRSSSDNLSYSFTGVKNSIAAALMPSLAKIMDKISKIINFLKEHKEFAISVFAGIATVITARLIPAFARLAVTMLANPITWIILGVIALSVAIGLLVDDFMAWKRGGASVIGSFLKWFDELKNKVTQFFDNFKAKFTIIGAGIDFIIDCFGSMWDSVKVIFDLVVALFTGNFDKMGDIVSAFIDKTVGRFSYIKDFIVGVFDSIKDTFNSILAPIFKTIDKVKGFFGGGSKDDAGAKSNMLSQANDPARSSVIDSSMQNNKNTSNNTNKVVNNKIAPTISAINITVPNGNAQDISNSIGSSLDEQLRNATWGFNSGMSH